MYKFLIFFLVLFSSCASPIIKEKSAYDYINPYMGNISHLLVPTYPTVHLPNSMLRVHPQREDHTSTLIKGLPVFMNRHRRMFTFNLSIEQGSKETLKPYVNYSYDNEIIRPNFFSLYLDENKVNVTCAVSHQSAIYEFKIENEENNFLVLNSSNGILESCGNSIYGYEIGKENTKIYVYGEVDREVISRISISDNIVGCDSDTLVKSQGNNAAVALALDGDVKTFFFRYAISYISVEQAKANLYREQDGFDLNKIKEYGRKVWDKTLSSIEVKGLDDDDLSVFYTSLYRFYERPVCLSEDGKYYSVEDRQIHEDNGSPFYTDDWLWDTHLTSHPLRTIINPTIEGNILNSFVSLAFHKPEGKRWLPTFPGPTGDYVSMNCNHGVISFLDALNKDIGGFDIFNAYQACRGAIEEKTLIPWRNCSQVKGYDDFYKEKGYVPALHPTEKETIKEVHNFEKRQAVAVTLGTSYDHWALSHLAEKVDKADDAEKFRHQSLNYRNLFNYKTRFFHPKDSKGEFIPNFDYQYCFSSNFVGRGGRAYYDENNAYIYRWDVKHNLPDLISLLGGREATSLALDSLFSMKLTPNKFSFYVNFGGDHSGNVGQYSMGNEPSFHIPYIYNYIGEPWKSQKMVRNLVSQWFRNDLMGIPGDEDGGAMSAFVVLSMMGFYPVTPGIPIYTIVSPSLPYIKINLENGNTFEIKVKNFSKENKYIQSVKMNSLDLGVPFISHNDIINGGVLEIELGNKANKNWGVCSEDYVRKLFDLSLN